MEIKTAEDDAKVKELATANNTIKNLNATLKYVEEKSGQADKLVAELVKEIQKANKEVDAIDIIIDKADTPSTEDVQ
ncbi:hypothetical protein [Bacillus sp. AFS017274]|uniref:hypothetical protein n=1 Tax=Bacillus sp. AFS017274 TaxID=2033488 RepID=UPI000BF24EA6|nr:hypothetical protein [Bacillus sp. AFS017274]PEZ76366.1 hypothetical protein CN380_21475 [Bacillus sp. AFS017274]